MQPMKQCAHLGLGRRRDAAGQQDVLQVGGWVPASAPNIDLQNFQENECNKSRCTLDCIKNAVPLPSTADFLPILMPAPVHDVTCASSAVKVVNQRNFW